MKSHEDAFGRELLDYVNGQNRCEIIERDDGHLDLNDDLQVYFDSYEEWPDHHKKAIEYARGRVLDVGCGAGRHALYLQRRGLDVTGIDISPLAIKVCGLRGLRDARVMSITGISQRLGVFDTVVMLANNFGLFGNTVRARWLLKKLHRITTGDAMILAESTDPHASTDPAHRRYRRRNLEKGRMPGQIRLRIRYRQYASPWYDYLLVSKSEMKKIIAGTGWRVDRFIDSEDPIYVAVLKKV
jgi:SAM-dependent methyltransferase